MNMMTSPENLEKQESKEGAFEREFGTLFSVETDVETFPGSKIYVLKTKDGDFVRYAISRDESGKLQGMEFNVKEKKTISGPEDVYWKSSSAPTNEARTNKDVQIMNSQRAGDEALSRIEEYLKSKGQTI